jgi:glutamine amidotransferase
MEVAIIKYNAGNVQSISNGLERLGYRYRITDDPGEIRSAEKVIFPGVGEASSTMKYLRAHKLDQLIQDLKQPVLGICLGMQLMCRYSEENSTDGLGIFDQVVKRFVPSPEHRVPQMGWNTLRNVADWLPKRAENQYAYFVHSYYIPVNEFTSAQADHSVPFSAAMRRDNFYAVQFHPEKSAGTGELVLQTFLNV